jgi:homoserine O-acetyltransferase
MFGNGLSSSPSNQPPPCAGADFPQVTVYDNAVAQHRLLMDHLGVRRIALALGWSLGALQAYQWAASWPDLVERLLPICGAARCAPHNFVFLEGVKAALTADCNFGGGRYEQPPVAGLKAFGRVYSGWAYSQTFFRDGLYRELGYQTLEDYLQAWEAEHLEWDANDLLCKLWSWQHADIASDPRHGGDFAAALRAISARAIVMPGDQDLYFTLEDSRQEVAGMRHAELRPFHSVYGHCAGGPGRFPAETAFLEQAIRDLLAR